MTLFGMHVMVQILTGPILKYIQGGTLTAIGTY